MSEFYDDHSDNEDKTHPRLLYNISELARMHISADTDVRIYGSKYWEFLRSYIPPNWVFVNTNHIQDCEYHLQQNESTLFFIDYQIPELQTFIQSYLDAEYAKN